jgi:cell wall-associated NlpC family hydrolase
MPRLLALCLALLLLAAAAGAQAKRQSAKPARKAAHATRLHAGAQAKRHGVKPKRKAVRPVRLLAPAVADSFRTIILTTCPENEEEAWAAAMREEMARWVSVRYRRAGLSMKGVDCSGFIKTIFRSTLSVDLPHSAASQALLGTPVETEELQFGDLLFFRAKKRISHVGIYLGDGYFVHSSRTFGVRVDSLFGSAYYLKRYARARRLVSPGSAAE